jgi:uncharacterized protein (DUF305 family)
MNLRAAALLGLITSTFSTVMSSLGGGRIGREPTLDWMTVGSIVLRDSGLQADPSWPAILTGILVHQSADLWWAVVFFGFLGRWTAGLRPWTILLLAAPWAVLTSAFEWTFLVPLVPFWWPLFTLEQPYWLGLVVHLMSSSLYPLFPWLRSRVARQTPLPWQRFTATWAGLALFGMLVLAVAALFGARDRELPHLGDDATTSYDAGYMRRMTAHHLQGVEIAEIAAGKAADERLRALARLMIAAQSADVRVFSRWWRSWFDGGEIPLPDPAQHAAMAGMVSPQQVAALRMAGGADFDRLFVELMSFHHQGAISMADEALRKAGDPRLKLVSHAIRFQQRGEIVLMHSVSGPKAVAMAVRALLDRGPLPPIMYKSFLTDATQAARRCRPACLLPRRCCRT